MNKYLYLILDIVFFVPILWYLYIKQKKAIKKYRRLLITVSLFGFIGYFVVDPLATYWHAWNYNPSHVLGVYFGQSVLETLIWAILLPPILALVVAIWSDKEKKKKLKWPTI